MYLRNEHKFTISYFWHNLARYVGYKEHVLSVTLEKCHLLRLIVGHELQTFGSVLKLGRGYCNKRLSFNFEITAGNRRFRGVALMRQFSPFASAAFNFPPRCLQIENELPLHSQTATDSTTSRKSTFHLWHGNEM